VILVVCCSELGLSAKQRISPQTSAMIDFIVKLAVVDSGGKMIDLGKRSSVSLPGSPHDELETCPAYSIVIVIAIRCITNIELTFLFHQIPFQLTLPFVVSLSSSTKANSMIFPSQN
jgi:hypothetical protein